MERYWEILRAFDIHRPCRLCLYGPFHADEIALRFLLHKLGFQLDVDCAKIPPELAIQGERAQGRSPDAPLFFMENQIVPALLGLKDCPFHLWEEHEHAARRRKNIARLLQHPGRLELALSLIDAGGMSKALLQPFLVAWKKAWQTGGPGPYFSGCAAQWLPPPVLKAADPSNGDYHFGEIEARIPGFSAFDFCRTLLSEGLPIFENAHYHVNFYAPDEERQASAWQYLARRQPVVLRPEILKLLEQVPIKARREKLQGQLWLVNIKNAGLLSSLLNGQPAPLEAISGLKLDPWHKGVLPALAPFLPQLEGLSLHCAGNFHAEDLMSFLRKTRVYRLTIKATGSAGNDIPPLGAWAGENPNIPLITYLHVSRFASINLDGIGHFQGLSQLQLPHNNLKHIPETLASLPHLQELDLSGNPIQSLPDAFFRLRLRKLWMDLGRLSDYGRYRVETTFSPAVLQQPYSL